MIFQRKYERAMKHLKEQTGENPKALEEENLADKLEKNDEHSAKSLITRY